MLSVLTASLQELPGGMLSPYEVATNNKSKNRYGNIVTCKFVYLFIFWIIFHYIVLLTLLHVRVSPPKKKKCGDNLHPGLKEVWTNETCDITFSTYINFISLITSSYCSGWKGITNTIKVDHDFCMRTQISNILRFTILMFIIRI